MPRILFVAAHRPGRSPSQRYRFEQFVPWWRAKGYEVTYRWTLDEQDDRDFYRPGALAPKARVYLKSWPRRVDHVRSATGHDLIFLQRETFMTRSTRFERMLAATGVPLVYDFDDAIWIRKVSEGNRGLGWLKDSGKIDRILPLTSLVIAGNEFLAAHARPLNPRVEVIPTVVDTDAYLPAAEPDTSPLVIGWTGSSTTVPHLATAIPMLHELQRRSKVPFMLRVISDAPLSAPGLPVENRPWSRVTEIADLRDIHIGIMPMEQDDWSRGKCAFKGLQYMALAKPVVLQDHGVSPEIIRSGQNGFLAGDPEQWIQALLQLLADADLRRRLGQAARATVEQRYSVQAWCSRYIQLFDQLIHEHKK